MSWLKKSSQALNSKQQEQNAARIAAEEERRRRIESWSSVTRSADIAVREWNKLRLTQILVDVNKSGILRRNGRLSLFACVFAANNNSGERFTYGTFDGHTGWRGYKGNHHFRPVYSTLKEGLEAETENAHGNGTYGNFTYGNPNDYSFSHVGQNLFVIKSEGDGESWGTITDDPIFSLSLSEDSININGTKYNLSQSTRNRRYIEGLVDSYLASKVTGT